MKFESKKIEAKTRKLKAHYTLQSGAISKSEKELIQSIKTSKDAILNLRHPCEYVREHCSKLVHREEGLGEERLNHLENNSDLQTLHGMDIEKEIMKLLMEEVRTEMDKELLKQLKKENT
jgi:hypothetical protein